MMALIDSIWSRLGKGGRFGLVMGIVSIAVAVGLLAYFTLRTEYQVMLTDVSPEDAAVMLTELDKAKIPYRIGEGGDTILVPKELVHKTRLKLLGNHLPLHGTVGFELFNNTDFGMTEFAQKVNYQRALQGEITRTILSIGEVQSARVHLALPEHGLFKKPGNIAKASITLTVRPGHALRPEQVLGIQRLVAASVAEIKAEDVTVLDQHGVALTRTSADGGVAQGQSGQLDLKRSTEEYLSHKVSVVLDRAFGAGQAIASVDVVLNRKHRRVTTEDVLPANGLPADSVPTGVVVRERQTTRGDPGDGGGQDTGKSRAGSGVSGSEVDYQVGKRIEHAEIAAGAIERLTVAVIVRKTLDSTQLERLREIVALAAGLDKSRGDAIAVYSMDQVAGAVETRAPENRPVAEASIRVREQAVPGEADGGPKLLLLNNKAVFVVVPLLLLAVLLFAIWAARARKVTSTARQLSEEERAALLSKVQGWITARQTKPVEPR